tara:strand:- start:2337 stop:3914 length:1578 start_codon:yes stop_codon:yes gene_type:complete
MSTDDQEASPDQQRSEIDKYASQNGYKIIRWYEDLGISGDNTAKRIDFQRMIGAGSSGEFEAILCWDQDRFGRFDMIEAGRWIHPLRQAGVHLATCTDGRIDWSDMASRLVYSVKQEGKHQFLRDLSKNVSRGMDKLARDGKWVTGVPPFGYVVDSEKNLQLSSPDDVALVKQIFKRYLDGESTRQISQWLSDRGTVSPKGKKWTATGIARLLKNERYLGYLVHNQRTSSKYKNADNPHGRMKTNPREDWTIVKNTHPAIVTQEQFDRVQEIFVENTRKTSPNPGHAFALSGLLRCGACGYGMYADKSNGVPSYTCYSYMERPDACERFNVRETEALRQILRALRVEFFEKYFSPKTVQIIKEEMRSILSGYRTDLEVIQNNLRKVGSQIEQAKQRLIEVPVDMVRHVAERIRQLEDQRDALVEQLGESEEPADKQVSAMEERIEAATGWLVSLEEVIETKYDGNEVNRMLKQFIDKVDIHIERVQWGPSGKRFRCNLVGGAIYFRTNELPAIFKSVMLNTEVVR